MKQLTREFLNEAGEALYGEDFRQPLAAALGISLRSLRRMCNDPDATIPPGLKADLINLIGARVQLLTSILKRLEP